LIFRVFTQICVNQSLARMLSLAGSIFLRAGQRPKEYGVVAKKYNERTVYLAFFSNRSETERYGIEVENFDKQKCITVPNAIGITQSFLRDRVTL